MKNEISDANSSNNEHQMLANYIKDVHLSLRKTASKVGAKMAWQEHCQNKEALTKYAKYMEKLATEHWTENNEGLLRISWAANFCKTYFIDELYLSYNEKERAIADKIDLRVECEVNYDYKINLIDVGSCYNPFKDYESFMNVTAIDLCPANDLVLNCDFLEVALGEKSLIEEKNLIQLQKESYEAVVFSFLLEYIPTSELRIKACMKAYDLLKPGGLLLISTPDSKHVGANAKLMKCWRYTLSQLGFNRIHYNKFKFIHCMAFRKSLVKEVAARWAILHKESYMEYAINIPQDFNTNTEEDEKNSTHNNEVLSYGSFEDMPFSNGDII